MKTYFLKGNRIYDPVGSITDDDLEDFLQSLRKTENLSNTTANNYLRYLKVLFTWLHKKKKIKDNPASAMDDLPTLVKKNKAFTDALLEKIKKDIANSGDIELLQFIEFLYYTATRPGSEARLLQNKHILFERQLLFIPAQISKNKHDDYIPLAQPVIDLLKDRKDQNPNHYIFGGTKPRSINHFITRFKPFKDKYELGEDWGLYSFKHTRAIHLAKAGADPYQIMTLFRHKSLEVTMKYLRELGIVEMGDLHAKARKF